MGMLEETPEIAEKYTCIDVPIQCVPISNLSRINFNKIMRRIFRITGPNMQGDRITETVYAHEQQYRFLDCEAFVKDHTMIIIETPELPVDNYSAVSYVWGGLQADEATLFHDGAFYVDCGTHSDGTPREDGGPINMKVLEYACRFSLMESAPYLWLDRLCIVQGSKADKNWQITHMYDVYKECRVCIVLPGGLQRLASMHEKMTWADRAWTFQEAIAPQFAYVLTNDALESMKIEECYKADAGFSVSKSSWVVKDECRCSYLGVLVFPAMREIQGMAEENTETPAEPAVIMGCSPSTLMTLTIVLSVYLHRNINDRKKYRSPLIKLLAAAQSRISSRPVDVVLSIMGLLGVTLDVERFRASDRFHATLALGEAMLRKTKKETHSFFDIPLWGYPAEPLVDEGAPDGAAKPFVGSGTLERLAEVMDSDTPEGPGSRRFVQGKVVAVIDWNYYKVENVYTINPADIAQQIQASDMQNAFDGQRVIVTVRDKVHGEQALELCRALDVGRRAPAPGNSSTGPGQNHLVVFGWSVVNSGGQPVLRLFKFDVSNIVKTQESGSSK